MSLPNDQRTVQDSDGNEIPFADIEVRDLAGGLVTIYSDPDGVTEITQPGFQSDANGFYRFYAQPGYYEITVTGPEGARVLARVNLDRGVTSLPDITSISDLNTAALVDGQQFHMTGWRTGSDLGGGSLHYDSTRPQTDHDGGTVFALSATPPTDFNDDSQIQVYLDAGGGLSGNGCLVRSNIDTVKPSMFGGVHYYTKAEAESGQESTASILASQLYARTNLLSLEFPKGAFTKMTATLETQPDGFFVETYIKGNGCTIVKSHDGIGVFVRGGALYQYIDNLWVEPDSTRYAADFTGTYDDPSKTITAPAEHGFHVLNTRVDLRCRVKGNKGFNVLLESTASNSNASVYDIDTSDGGSGGLYIKGTADDLSVSKMSLRSRAEFGPGLWIEEDTPFRNWDYWIYIENGCRGAAAAAQSIPAQLYVGRSIDSKGTIYSENQSGFEEIRVGPACEASEFMVLRGEVDDYSTTRDNRWISPGEYRINFARGIGQSLRQVFVEQFTATPVRAGATTEYMDLIFRGASLVELGRIRVTGNGITLLSPDGSERLSTYDAELGLGDGPVNSSGDFSRDGTRILTTQQAAIADSVGGDEQAKINSILAALRTHGLIAT